MRTTAGERPGGDRFLEQCFARGQFAVGQDKGLGKIGFGVLGIEPKSFVGGLRSFLQQRLLSRTGRDLLRRRAGVEGKRRPAGREVRSGGDGSAGGIERLTVRVPAASAEKERERFF